MRSEVLSAPESTIEFERWFAGSRVVDASGRPLVLYHGTTAAFEAFNAQKLGRATAAAWSRLGFFFTQDASLASDFTKGKNWAKPHAPYKHGANVLPVYMALRNPLHVTASTMLPMSGSEERIVALRASAEANGHDGVVIGTFRDSFDFVDTTNELKYPQYVAFRPEQIKSAIANCGDFDPGDPRITFKRTAETTPADESDAEEERCRPRF